MSAHILHLPQSVHSFFSEAYSMLFEDLHPVATPLTIAYGRHIRTQEAMKLMKDAGKLEKYIDFHNDLSEGEDVHHGLFYQSEKGDYLRLRGIADAIIFDGHYMMGRTFDVTSARTAAEPASKK